jgi:hypothetical protein
MFAQRLSFPAGAHPLPTQHSDTQHVRCLNWTDRQACLANPASCSLRCSGCTQAKGCCASLPGCSGAAVQPEQEGLPGAAGVGARPHAPAAPAANGARHCHYGGRDRLAGCAPRWGSLASDRQTSLASRSPPKTGGQTDRPLRLAAHGHRQADGGQVALLSGDGRAAASDALADACSRRTYCFGQASCSAHVQAGLCSWMDGRTDG